MVESSMTQTMPSRGMPSREDCWSEEATSTLVDAWGCRYMELNRGNLRQKDWQEVADAVNALHGHTQKTRRTDVQCKNRIDTLKKKYKIEKAKIVDSNGTLISSWPFFGRLEELIGPNYDMVQKITPLGSNSNSPPMAVPLPYRKLSLPSSLPTAVPLPSRKLPLPSSVPTAPVAMPPQMKLQPVILPQKRPFSATEDSSLRRNYSAVAAAAAATKPVVEEEGGESSEEMENDAASEETGAEVEGMSMLAKAIERFGEIYERVEEMKQRQVVELEKQRMQFFKDLEVQRMQLFMDTQVQLEKIKQAAKRSESNDSYG